MEEKKYQIVTIEEMRTLAQCDAYKGEFEELMQLMSVDSIEEISPFQINWRRPSVLFDHLIFEQSMASYGGNWRFYTHVYDVRAIAYLKYLWYHPLVWLDPKEELSKNRIVEGRVAAEHYVPHRESIRYKYDLLYFDEAMLDWFADRLPIADGTEPIIIDYKFATLDIILWHYITENPEKMYDLVYAENGRFDPSLVVPFDQRRFLFNVTRIAETHGGKRAAEIVRLLRKDWKRITTMKLFDIEKMKAEQVEEFRVALFEGMDYYLAEWEKDKVEEKEKPNAEKPDGSFFAVSEKMTYEMCEKELIRVINGAKNKAAACREILRSETVGYFVLSDKTDQEKADAINPWVAFTDKNYVFTGDDFRKARNS